MKTIAIDEEVFGELQRRVQGFNESPNDVLRKVLKLSDGGSDNKPESPRTPLPPSPILEMVGSSEYWTRPTAVDQYLYILFWLYQRHRDDFPRIEKFGSGKRVYFSKDQNRILTTGKSVTAKPIPKSPYWALVTLDNPRKRMIIIDILRLLGYSDSEADAVARTIEDSGRRRGRSGYSGTL